MKMEKELQLGDGIIIKNKMENKLFKINNLYNNEEIIREMENFFEKEGFIQMNNFFEGKINLIKNKLINEKFDFIYNPMKYRKYILDSKKVIDFELVQIIEFFKSKEFIDFIEKIIGFELVLNSLEILKYSHKSFTIINDEEFSFNNDLIEVIYDLSDNFKEEMGGILTFTSKEEEILYLDPSFNTLSIIYKPNQIMDYLKYINHKSEKRNILRFKIKFDFKEEF